MKGRLGSFMVRNIPIRVGLSIEIWDLGECLGRIHRWMDRKVSAVVEFSIFVSLSLSLLSLSHVYPVYIMLCHDV